MTPWPPLDRDRFAKCRALMERGATPGERAAGRAAATRIAAAAGLTLVQAEASEGARRTETAARPRPASDEAWRARNARPGPQARPESKAPPEPITVEELQAQKRAADARRRKMAEREARRLRALHAEQERQSAAVRAAQGERDRAWTEARAWAEAQAGGAASGERVG
ncbi:hypothetical protein PMNALOAF_0114 [Methylobacterium adhaesivum]|uniref:Cell envelope biogenesis protein TolA n=1 Tax=Methylobacterium adhaesivum TaxID=333297 RepID=A0ABT8BEB1_9HYPH|nr:hypothetical protein [Methylobacterium adhaesivum]MDN3589822.1 hypothetical protein [Methylobacterium adhaesivum]GJD28882.1 hypothetical protein PMNALOAF_0114 [Methylobacterium adhaesivum]